MSQNDDDILAALELAQRVENRHHPYPRRRLAGWEVTLLWLLRLYVFIAVPLVIYAFVRALRGGG